jgi:hypothetical protein
MAFGRARRFCAAFLGCKTGRALDLAMESGELIRRAFAIAIFFARAGFLPACP